MTLPELNCLSRKATQNFLKLNLIKLKNFLAAIRIILTSTRCHCLFQASWVCLCQPWYKHGHFCYILKFEILINELDIPRFVFFFNDNLKSAYSDKSDIDKKVTITKFLKLWKIVYTTVKKISNSIRECKEILNIGKTYTDTEFKLNGQLTW